MSNWKNITHIHVYVSVETTIIILFHLFIISYLFYFTLFKIRYFTSLQTIAEKHNYFELIVNLYGHEIKGSVKQY